MPFNELERQMIRKYFKENEYVHYVEEDESHSGTQTKIRENQKIKERTRDLPPGIAKNLERGKPLPPGIAKRNLPSGLESSLPGNMMDTRQYIVGK